MPAGLSCGLPDPMRHSGEIAALLTAICWSTNSVLFAMAGRRVGSATVNVVRLAMAWLFLLGLSALLTGSPFPFDAGGKRLAWLAVSGLIGFAVGDAVLFEALVRIGPRLSMLVMTLWPVMSAILAWLFLGQGLGAAKLVAMLVTLGGIAVVVAERSGDGPAIDPRQRWSGLLLALGGAAGQAIGFLFSRFGLEGGLHPVPANVVRASAGLAALAAWQLARGSLAGNFRRLEDRRATLLIAAGALSGPVAGVVLSLYAAAHASSLGVASTLMSLSPVILLPVSALFLGERLSLRAVLGTLVTVAGAAGLFFL
jgi:drug/metabolite transporter (DMT)-like permease